MTFGNIGAFKWCECVPLRTTALLDTMLSLRHHLTGLRAVNVSWDSGLMIPSDEERACGWALERGRAVSPVIDDSVIENWPWCDAGFDEWYFFSSLPENLELSAYCNWTGLSLADWPRLVNVPTAPNLRQQLERVQPTVVLGMGERLFVISASAALIEDAARALRKV